MITDQQVRRLKQMRKENKSLVESACKSGMSEKTARKYLESGKLPSEVKKEHTWRTREDPFESDWPEIKGMLETEPRLEALTIFQYLQRKNPRNMSI
jgi:transposase